MFKIILLLLCMTISTSHAASFNCKYYSGYYGTLQSIYYCHVQNSVTITSLDAAQIDSVTGTHQAGYTNDDVEALTVPGKGQINYFPRGLGKIFKNLKAIQIYGTKLREIHQSDLKDFPNLRNLYLYNSFLEILEENLFKFNPNLELIHLSSNRISHIDPNVFDMLTNLKTLKLGSNTCIDMSAYNDPADVQNVIKVAKAGCKNSEFLNLEHKVRNLVAASATLNSEQFEENLENLENEVENSKFPNFFQSQLQDLKADQVKKAQEEA